MVKFTKKIVENSENFLIKKFINQFKRKIKNKGRARFSFVLTGGKSPIKLYRKLAKINIKIAGIEKKVAEKKAKKLAKKKTSESPASVNN